MELNNYDENMKAGTVAAANLAKMKSGATYGPGGSSSQLASGGAGQGGAGGTGPGGVGSAGGVGGPGGAGGAGGPGGGGGGAGGAGSAAAGAGGANVGVQGSKFSAERPFPPGEYDAKQMGVIPVSILLL